MPWFKSNALPSLLLTAASEGPRALEFNA